MRIEVQSLLMCLFAFKLIQSLQKICDEDRLKKKEISIILQSNYVKNYIYDELK